MVEAAGVELDRNWKPGLIPKIPAELEWPESLKCFRAGTKQVQQIAWRATRRPRPEQPDNSPSEIPGTIQSAS
jgi:hypothetical protein